MAMKKISDNFRVMWVVSCIVILIIPILISGWTGAWTLRELERANIQNNELVVKEIQKEMDFAVDNIFRMKVELISNHDIYVVSSISRDEVRNYQYELSEICNALKVYQRSMQNVENSYIYFNNIDTVVSSDGIFSTDEFFSRCYRDTSITKEQWLGRLELETNGDFSNARRNTEGGIEEEIQYYCNLRMIGQVNPPMFCAAIEQSYLNDILQSTSIGKEVYTLVLSSDNRFLLGNALSGEEIAQWAEGQVFEGMEGYISSEIENQKVMASYVTGSYTDWRYMSVAPASEYWAQVSWQRGLTIGGLLISFLFGCLCIWAVIKKNYSPMEHILSLLKKAVPAGEEGGNQVGEYQYIEAALSEVLEQKAQAVDTMERQKKPLQDSFIVRLLRGNLGGLPSLEDALHNIGLVFEKKDFIVMAVYVEDYTALFQEEEEMDDLKRVSLAHFILSNILEELFGGGGAAHMVVMEEMPVLLINLAAEGQQEWVREQVRYAAEFLNSHFSLGIQIGISNPKESFEGISEAYDEAVETVEYKVLLGREDILFYHEMPRGGENKYRYGYSIEHEQNLIAAVQTGSYELAEGELDQIFDSVRGTDNLNIAKCFMFDVGSTIIKTIEEIHPQWDEESAHLLSHVQALLESSSIARMQSGLKELLKEMCAYFAKRKQEVRLSDRIDAYLMEHYGDVNLNVAAIGEAFGMVPRYISKMFKDETGEGLLDHINRLRVEEAKKIMKNKELRLEEIAARTGFTNINTFIRVFKKYEHVTPGRYRELLSGE